jgi:hypothetical protein
VEAEVEDHRLQQQMAAMEETVVFTEAEVVEARLALMQPTILAQAEMEQMVLLS